MSTAERRETPGRGAGASTAARGAAQAPDHSIPADADPGISQVREPDGGWGTARDEEVRYTIAYRRPLWVEEPARRRRLPDPVRTSAVRAVLIISVTLIQAVIAFLCTLAGSWLAFPMVLSSVAGTVVATWGVLDVWITRQVWNQRHGVVSAPSSTARAMRRERRAARRRARTAQQRQERIRRQGNTGRQLSHP
ncbi:MULTISPECIES: hypothetical protein [unclassified Streptomyces]|uniref:hypothetical protein n=1 Tax=unclassified Streptomyces TaxID=2593676 RepID=UPI0033AB3310